MRQLNGSVNVAEKLALSLGFRWRIQTAMECMDEDKLKVSLIEYHTKFPDQENYVRTWHWACM